MDELDNFIVIKRNGRRVSFDRKKIAIAIKKGFDSVYEENKEKDANYIYNKVLETLEKYYNSQTSKRISIEKIQDTIEKELLTNNYNDVYESFKKYRENRKNARNTYEQRNRSKFISVNEKILDMLIDSEGEKPKNAIEKYGKMISKQYAKSYIIKRKYLEMIEESELYIHNLDTIPQGMTGYTQLSLNSVLNNDIIIGEKEDGIKISKPKTIEEVLDTILIILEQIVEEQYFGESIPSFDYLLEPYILETFKIIFKNTLFQNLKNSEFLEFLPKNGIEREIEKIQDILVDLNVFNQYIRESKKVEDIIKTSYDCSIKKLKERIYNSLENFFIKTNILAITNGKRRYTINMGSNNSNIARLLILEMISVLENNEFKYPEIVYKVKNGINLEENDLGYDLLKKFIELKKDNIRFSLLDSKQNNVLENDNLKEVAYTYGHRILDNNIDDKRQIVEGRGMLAGITINLANIPMKLELAKKKITNKNVIEEIDQRLNSTKQILYDIFEEQTLKKKKSFPMLLENEIWIDSDKIKDEDRLRRVLKHGILEVSFVGLYELIIQTSDIKNNCDILEVTKREEKILKYMKKRCDEFSEELNINIQLSHNMENDYKRLFIQTDIAMFGEVKNITTKEKYNNSYMLDKDILKKMKIEDRIVFEGHFHKYLTAGHIINFTKDEILKYNTKEEYVINMLKIIRLCIENNIGLISII